MSHPAYYQTATQESYSGHQPYRPGDYVPQNQLQLSQNRYSPQPSPTYGPPVTYQPGPYEPEGYSESRRSSRHHQRRHSSDNRAIDRRYRDEYVVEERREKRGSRDHSHEKGLASTLAGAAGGGYLGHKIGGGAIGTVGGLLAGAIGARELEKRHERHKRERSRGGDGHSSRSRHSSPTRTLGGYIEKAQDKVENFLSPDRARDKDDGRKQRHRSEKGSRSLSRGRYSDSEDDEYYRRR
ncbi:MAG: hypothetical protein HETSPECPRED_009934 [Heterodermia speciosa]|uniref:Glycine zipper 2TM domain-containing protein n=1 Tax=Heterodermia speciosa TaxID=116794 RepID=A0A8H3G3A0_9LECA|nr:MAG: hypothetical protein HETSPECPRED_009934 [Heterodermia speciosa]